MTPQKTNVRVTVFLLAVLTLGLSGSAMAQEWAHAMFDTSKHDFGEQLAGQVVEQRFKIKNNSTDKYQLESSVSAGEFFAEFSSNSIDAGETVELICRFQPSRQGLGARSATATVRFLGDKNGEHQISLKGKTTLVKFEPGELDFADVKLGEEAQTKAKLIISNFSNLQLADVQCKYRHVRARVGKPTKIEGAIVYNMNFRLLATAPRGTVEKKLSFVFRKIDKPKAKEVVKRLAFKAKVKREE